MIDDKKQMANDGAVIPSKTSTHGVVRITEGLLKKGGLITPTAAAIANRPAPPPPQRPAALPPLQQPKTKAQNNDK
jgi:hypothetical protein